MTALFAYDTSDEMLRLARQQEFSQSLFRNLGVPLANIKRANISVATLYAWSGNFHTETIVRATT